jgi:polyhydroxyalkanoate synthesis regulator phasin
MTEPSENLQALIDQLKNGEIDKAEYERRSSELIDSIVAGSETGDEDTVRRERIRSTADMARSL